MKSALTLCVICIMLGVTLTTTPVFSGPPYYHEEGNVNYPGSRFESIYIDKGIGVDDYVTLIDVALYMRAYMTVSTGQWGVGWDRYNPDADINNDSIVNIFDLVRITAHLGLNYHYITFEYQLGITKVKVRVPDNPVGVNERFNVSVEIENVEGLHGFEFTLRWNSTLLKAVSVTNGDFLQSVSMKNVESLIYSDHLYAGLFGGRIWIDGTWYYDEASGNGTLAIITFECLGIGESTLDLSSRLFDINLNSMPHQDIDGIVQCGTPQDRIQSLIETIKSWNLPKGTTNSLVSKLEDALHLLDKENENGAIHKLMDFIEQVEALRGKKLTNKQADYLVSETQRIIELIKK